MKKLIKITVMFSIIILAILLPNITSATSNSIIIKQLDKYLIYNENTKDKEFTFAFSATTNKTDLIFYAAAKDSETEEANYVAYVDETNRDYFNNENSEAYLFIKDAEGIIGEPEKISLKNATDIELVETTTKRIMVDTTKNDVTTTEINGVKTEVTKGKVVITDSANLDYSYILIKLPINEENDYSKLMNLAEKISNKEELKKLDFMQKLELMNKFYSLYKKLEPNENDGSWLKVENSEILEPQDSKNGEKYIVFIKGINKDTMVIDAQFMTCYDKYNPIYEKETVTIKETSKLPVTYDSIALIVIFVIVVIATIVVLIIKYNLNKKKKNM